MSPLINWNENLPSDGSTVKAGEIRDVWAALTAGLNESLEWAGAVAGQLRAGAAPSFITTEANIASLWESNASSTGKLAFASDTSRLFTLGIVTTVGRAAFAGGPQLMEHATQPQPGEVWLIGSGTSFLPSKDGDSVITFNSNGLDSSDALVYETPPQVLATSDHANYMPVIINVTGTSFAVSMRPLAAGAVDVNIHWISSGTSTI